MLKNTRTRLRLGGAIGLLGVAGFFWLQNMTPSIELMRMKLSREQLLQKADADFERTEFADFPLSRSFEFSLNKPLYRYAISHRDSLPEKHPLPLVEFKYERKGEITLADGSTREVTYSATYSGSGHMLGVSRAFPRADTTTSISFSAAVERAKQFLFAAAFDTSDMRLEQNSLFYKNNRQTYDFVLSRTVTGSHGALKGEHKVTIAGGKVIEFDCTIEPVVSSTSDQWSASDIMMIALTVLMVLSAFIISLSVIVKKNRRDELDYAHSKVIAMAGGVLITATIAVSSWGEWTGLLLGAPLGGLFVAMSVLALFALGESVARDVWPEKLHLSDALFNRHFRIRELGDSIHAVLLASGLTLFWYGFAQYFLEQRFDIYVSDTSPFWVLKSTAARVLSLASLSSNNLLAWAMFLVFFPAWLAGKLPDRKKWLPLFTVFLLILSLMPSVVRPFSGALALTSGGAVVIALLVAKSSVIAPLLVLLIVFTLRDFGFLLILPDAFSDMFLSGMIAGMVLLWVVGVYLQHSGVPVQEVGHYVPDYFSRIAERERVRKELEIARNVQMRFLPDAIPDVSGLEIASICRPATEVGGDYYDFLHVDQDWFGVVIGDVSGKGVSAAFYMTMAKGIIKTLARTIRTPARLLSEMNAVFFENSPRQVFISVIYGVFDLKNRKLHFARAGHNPLIVHKKHSGAPEKLHPKGIAIGLAEAKKFDAIIEEQSIPIKPGDVFVFYTDGISEAMNSADEIFGEERLATLIMDNAHLSAQALLDIIHEEITRFEENTPQHDDFTMIIVKVARE